MDLIDPEEFPFSQEEVYLAFRLTVSTAKARAQAARIAQLGREARAARESAQQALARGSRDPAEVNHDLLYLSPEVFALLAAVSPALAARVDAYWERYYAQVRALRLRNALHLAKASSLDNPAAAEVRAAIDAKEIEERDHWHTVRSTVEAGLRRHSRKPVGG